MPGPAPSYQPVFPVEFLIRARLLSRCRAAPACLVQRARLVLLLDRCPAVTNVEAASRSGLHPNSVRIWRRRWAGGDFALEDRAGRGRKPAFSPLGPCPGQGAGL